MTSDAVRFERADDDTIGILTLDRPDNRNSMTPELLEAFAARVVEARAVATLRCVVITGRGACFSAGADFKSVVQLDGDGPPRAPHEKSVAMYQPFLSTLTLEVPVIAALNGHTIGGGFGLALCADLRIGARGARYGANFTRLGLSPGMAISYLLPRLVGVARANELLFTGRLIDGDEAARIGLELAPRRRRGVAARARAGARDRGQRAAGGARDQARDLPRPRLGSAGRRGPRGVRPGRDPPDRRRRRGHRRLARQAGAAHCSHG